MSKGTRITIIGGGVAGMTAAIVAARRGGRVLIIEREERLGRKLLLTGNGKCNLGNTASIEGKYNTNFIKKTMQKYPLEEIISFLKSLGVVTRVDNGRVFPYSNEASTVQNALREGVRVSGAKILTGKIVSTITDKYLINNNLICDKVVLSTGSPATVGLDSTSLFAPYGHPKIAMKPGLVPMITDRSNLKGLRGVRVLANVSLFKNGHLIAVAKDEVLFKDNGVSGTAIFDLSVKLARIKEYDNVHLELDLMPEYTEESISDLIKTLNGIDGLFHKELCKNICKNAGFRDPIAIAREIKHYTIKDVRLGPFHLAQIASGGLDTSFFDPLTLESKLSKGLYAAGEVLDVDGECGGYNLMWAFASGLAVGNAL